MPNLTTNYSLLKPLVGDPIDEDLWGGELNNDMDAIDTLMRQGITIETKTSQTSNFNASASISIKYLYPCNATGGAFTATIPVAATAGNGATVYIKKTDSSANAVTLARSSSDTLDGSTTLSLTSEDDCLGLVSDGVSRWNSICEIAQIVVPDASTTVKGIIEIATDGEALAGSDTTRAVTSAGLASSKSLAADGHMKLPGGLIIQWGYSSSPSTSTTVTFPVAFATACYSVQATLASNDGREARVIGSVSTTAFDCSANEASTFYWFAIGV